MISEHLPHGSNSIGDYWQGNELLNCSPKYDHYVILARVSLHARCLVCFGDINVQDVWSVLVIVLCTGYWTEG